MAVRKQKAPAPQAGQIPNAGHMEQAEVSQERPGASLPALTVRVFPVRNSRSKLKATANVNIAGAFAVQGFRIFDSKNGLFVKEPEQSYVKEGTEMSRSVFFPVTKEARDALYGQILHSYELTMEKEMGQRADELEDLLGDEYAPPERQFEPPPEEYAPPEMQEIDLEDDLPFDFGQSM